MEAHRSVGLALAGVLTSAVPAAAEPWHGGLNLRADSGAHPIRVVGGYQWCAADVSLVLDPMFWTDGQHDLDALVNLRPDRFGPLLGWRTTFIGIADGHQAQQKLLVGVSAPLPDLGPLRARWSFELATLIVKHGGDLPSKWIGFASGRDFVDLLNFGMFVTVEYEGR